MAQLAQRAPDLYQLQCTCQLPPEPAVLVFPRRLLYVTLTLGLEYEDDEINTLFTSLNALLVLDDLTLDFDIWVQPEVDFTLLHPPALTRFSITVRPEEEEEDYNVVDDLSLTNAQLDAFRAPFFANLQQFIIPKLHMQYWRHLLRTPHTIRWKEMSLPGRVWREDNAAIWTSLASSLTKLSLWPTLDINFLPQLKCLTELDLSVRDADVEAVVWTMPAAVVLASFNSMSLLTTLQLCVPFTSKDMASFLPRIPLLTNLSLQRMAELETLAFFSQCTAAHHALRSLTLDSCGAPKLHVNEIVHLLCFTSLSSLTLDDSFVEPLDLLGQALFEIPSRAFPALKLFQFWRRLDEAPAPV